MDFEQIFQKVKRETMVKRIQGTYNQNREIFLSRDDMRKNRFQGVDRQLFEVSEKSEKWASDSSNSNLDENLNGEEKLE